MKDRIIGKQWDRFAELFLPPGVSKDQYNDVQRTFYIGVRVGINQMLEMAKSGLTDKEKIEWLDIMMKEVNEPQPGIDQESN